MKVAFLGLGRMGRPMARRLLDAGHDVRVWNRTPSKAEGFPDVAGAAHECVLGAACVITMLADPAAVRDVVFGLAVRRSLRPDAVFVDMSTVGPEVAVRLRDALPCGMLDAPVGGGVAQVSAGDLTVLVGGAAEHLARVREVLDVFGEVVHCGPVGSGQAMKLAFNLVLAVTQAAIGEAIGLAERHRIDVDTALRVLERGGGGAQVAKKASRIAARDYDASFTAELMRKDLALSLDTATESGDPLAFAHLAERTFAALVARERGGEDYSAVVELFRPPPAT